MSEILFTRPFVSKRAMINLHIVLEKEIQQGNGEFSKEVDRRIESLYPGYNALLMPSCTAALELCLMLLDVGPGDEVILPSFNFPSAATAVTKFWATPVFCDINPSTGCLEFEDLESKVSEKTKAIIWVDYAGLAPEIQKISSLANKRGIALIEDAAHMFGSQPRAGQISVADFVAFSFHATKNIQCGEGGALLIKDAKIVERAYVMREKGTNRREHQLGKVQKYRWVDRGSSYLLPEICAAVLSSQLDERSTILAKRQSTIAMYRQGLAGIDAWGWETLLDTENAGHMFALLAPSGDERESLLAQLRNKGIFAASHYEDLATSPAGKKLGKVVQECVNSYTFSKRVIRLPVYVDLTDTEIDYITEVVISGLYR